jgi:hypothetical protein
MGSDCIPCGHRRAARNAGPRVEPKSGEVASAESFAASASPRYLVVPRQTSTTGKRFSTLTAAQDHARRTGGIIRQL